jgi:hypothetical protein
VKSSLRIIVTGLIAQHPLLGGITWHYLQYVIGLARLGHDVYYFEDSGEFPYNLDGGASGNDWIAQDCSYNVGYLAKTMSRYDLEKRWAYHFPLKSEWYGLSDKRRLEVIGSADLLINVSGSLERPGNYRRIPHLIYIDTDPVITQIKIAQDDALFVPRVDAHDTHFSFGEKLSQIAPDTGYRWRPTRQPIMLSEWRPATSRGENYTTVMNWASYAPLIYSGLTYGQKDVEFKRFLELPKHIAPVQMELALSRTRYLEWKAVEKNSSQGTGRVKADKSKLAPRDAVTNAGWRVVDAMEACGDLDSYRHYIESSKAEWSVAKNAYVVGQPGWFSERSACYLAAGRPVVVQDVGFARILPVGKGILSFRTLEEAAAAIKEVETNYTQHAQAAREIAEAFFDSDKVLTHLIEEAMSSNDDRAVDNTQQNVSSGGTPTTIMRPKSGDQEQPPRSKNPTATEILQSDLLQHPAVKALTKLQPECQLPEQIEVLKQKEKGAVYRLAGVGPGHSAVIAKRGRLAKIAIERAVYEKVLPHLPVKTLDYYGFIEEEDGRFCWLFLGDVGDQRYSPFVEECRAAAARWLGTMHTVAVGLDAKAVLPDRGADNYLAHLSLARDMLPRIRVLRSLKATDQVVLRDIVALCEYLNANWDQVEKFCERFPCTFVHGDCLAKNVHVQRTQAGFSVAPFDWGGAGWGLPATDLGQLALPYRDLPQTDPDWETYLNVVRKQWPNFDRQTVQQLANLGQLFWALKVISRSVPEFDDERTHLETLINNYKVYASVLANSIRVARWVN